MEYWEELSEERLKGAEYTNAKYGWRNTETTAEVIVYKTEGTGMEEVTDKDWAVQHPPDDEDVHTQFFDTDDAAIEFAEDYLQTHQKPVTP